MEMRHLPEEKEASEDPGTELYRNDCVGGGGDGEKLEKGE